MVWNRFGVIDQVGLLVGSSWSASLVGVAPTFSQMLTFGPTKADSIISSPVSWMQINHSSLLAS